MSSNKKYRLLKDLPQLPKGSIFEWYLNNGTCDLYSCGGTEYSEPFIKQKTDWFELIEDKHYYTISSMPGLKLYSEKQLLEVEERAFNAGRQVHYYENTYLPVSVYYDFSDYKNRTK